MNDTQTLTKLFLDILSHKARARFTSWNDRTESRRFSLVSGRDLGPNQVAIRNIDNLSDVESEPGDLRIDFLIASANVCHQSEKGSHTSQAKTPRCDIKENGQRTESLQYVAGH